MVKNWRYAKVPSRFGISILFYTREKYRTVSNSKFDFSKGTKLFCLRMTHLLEVPKHQLSRASAQYKHIFKVIFWFFPQNFMIFIKNRWFLMVFHIKKSKKWFFFNFRPQSLFLTFKDTTFRRSRIFFWVFNSAKLFCLGMTHLLQWAVPS